MKAVFVSGSCLPAALVLASLGFISIAQSAFAKEPSLTAIELYTGASGPGYIQLTDVLINGKVELRDCSSAATAPIDKSTYGKLPKLSLSAGSTLIHSEEGPLQLSTGTGPAICVLPENVKFEHNAVFTAAAIADLADLKGRPIGPGSDGATDAQPLKKGVKLAIVAAPNLEMAEYLLGQRAGSVTGWQSYLTKYPESPHTSEAKRSLAALDVAAGEKSLSAYQKTAASASPSYADLKDARVQADLAHAAAPDLDGSVKLAAAIRKSLDAIVDKGRAELAAYNTALTSQSAGYAHLQNAKKLAEAATSVDPKYAAGLKLQADVTQASNTYESAIKTATSASAAKQWEASLQAVAPYRAFGEEDPRVSQIINDAYTAYFEQAKQAETTKDWKGAIDAYGKAMGAKETDDARNALKAAQSEATIVENETAARAAADKSKTFELQKDMIDAYEVLANLPPAQRAIVADEVTRLTPDYINAASQRAKEITKAYPNIAGIGDERAVESAYNFLEAAYQLSTDDAAKAGFKSRLDNLADELATWFLDRAKHYLQKPLGSGTELGWAFLKEAESYKAANLEAVRDQIKLAEPAHAMHSKLSIRVQFRDQTSQRQSEGFAGQMESAIISSLDTSGLPVKVVRYGETTTAGVDPDFGLAGDVLEHHIAAPPTVESVDSKFIAGVHEIPSEDWNKANRAYDSANSSLHTVQSALQGAEAKGNKKDINELNQKVAEAQKKVDDARVALDSIAKSRTEDIVRPYTYKKTTYDVNNRLLLQFRIDDLVSGQKGEPVQVTKQDKKQFVVLSEVNAEDTNGVKSQGTIPDNTELQTELENVARGELIKRVLDQVHDLPNKLYDSAKKREADSYPEDAGESYLRYLNVTSAQETGERQHAEKYLKETFNFLTFPSVSQ
jgi:hypothetical protein